MARSAHVIGIGFPKAATTYISRILASHPQISFSERKETHFFEKNEFMHSNVSKLEQSYSKFWPQFNPIVHRARVEWTTTYITNHSAIAAIAYFYKQRNPPLFLVAVRNPIDSALSNYFYRRMALNSDAAIRTQKECFISQPEIFIAPYQYNRHYVNFRSFFPDAQVILIPQNGLANNPDNLFVQLFDALHLSPWSGWTKIPYTNVSYPYRSRTIDRLIRWILVHSVGDARSQDLYRLPNYAKPTLLRAIHSINQKPYAWESGVQKIVSEQLQQDFNDFVDTVEQDANCLILGTKSDLIKKFGDSS
tara:strand:- start:8785 stop:9702 length:918 start_codon:yes stop_codon:yes gene_type:complete